MTRLHFVIGAFLLAGGVSASAQGVPPPGGPDAGMTHGSMEGRPMGAGPMGAGPMMGGHGGMGMHRPMMTKAAVFRFRRDGAEIDIRCAADEPTKACVEAASILIDKVTSAK